MTSEDILKIKGTQKQLIAVRNKKDAYDVLLTSISSFLHKVESKNIDIPFDQRVVLEVQKEAISEQVYNVRSEFNNLVAKIEEDRLLCDHKLANGKLAKDRRFKTYCTICNKYIPHRDDLYN